MKICWKCIQKQSLRVQEPYLLKVYNGCEFCGSSKKSFDVDQIKKQNRILND